MLVFHGYPYFHPFQTMTKPDHIDSREGLPDLPLTRPPLPRPILSLIVPVYNVATFLERCLDSLTSQTLDGLEILCVDDGSTDQSPAILAGYAARYPQLRVIRQVNGGPSLARNTGLDNISGEYVGFVDADDWIEPNYYTQLLELARSNNLDMAHGNAMFHYEGRQQDRSIYSDNLSAEVMPGREVLRRRLADQSLLHMVWMHLYRSDFIKRHKLRFIPETDGHEDVLWTTSAFVEAQRVAYDPSPGYFYRKPLRELATDAKDKSLEGEIRSFATIARGMRELAAPLEDDPRLQQLLHWQMVDGAMSIFHKLKQINSSQVRRRVYRKLRADGLYRLLWSHAKLGSQRRRIARSWFKSWMA